MAQTYKRPKLPAETTVAELHPENQDGVELTPKTKVVILNRGLHDVVDKFDGITWRVPPGYAEVEYEVAAHLHDRAVVPGSRDPMSGKQTSFIAIPGMDPPDRCTPFTDEQCRKFDLAPEAIDREAFDNEADRKVIVVSTQAARARTAGGGSRRPRQEVTSPDALAPPDRNDAFEQIRRDQAGADDER